ncbi:hypothetical protein BH23ACT5_BH23ACT5_11270 [soil metagenome]
MFERFTKDVRRAVFIGAEEAAVVREDPRIGTEHLLLGVVAAGDTVAAAHGLTCERLRDLLDRRDSRALASLGVDAEVAYLGRRLPSGGSSRWLRSRPRNHVPFTRASKQSLERSLRICRDEGHRRITSAHLLLAALVTNHGNDPAIRLLAMAGINPSAIDRDLRRAWQAGS